MKKNIDNNTNELSAREIFSINLNYYIKQSGKSVYQISKDTGIAHSYLYDLLKEGNKKKPSFDMQERIANYFQIEVAELFKNR